MTAAAEELIEDARAVTIAEAVGLLDLKFTGKRDEHPQPCPACGGTDCFSFNTAKNAWNCRYAGVGGRDAIGMAAHCHELRLDTRAGLLEACSILTGKPVPDDAERESPADRDARLARLEKRRQENLEAMAKRNADGDDYRERERNKARGIHGAAVSLRVEAARPARLYIGQRSAADPLPFAQWLRFSGSQTYWHGEDDFGRPAALHAGPAIVAPFIGPPSAGGRERDCASGLMARPAGAPGGEAADAAREAGYPLIGCHITWIDLANPPKYRPPLVDPSTGEVLPTKKMRGSKKGGLIPLLGDPAAARWVGGEGIENGAAFAGWEGYRADTFYFAAGDLGNLAGPADPASRFAHPTLKKKDRNGRERPVMVQGPVPKPDQSPDDAMWVGEHVDELVLLADGDSEPVMTAAAMRRARKRHQRPAGQPPRLTLVMWPRAGLDFSRMAVDYASGDE